MVMTMKWSLPLLTLLSTLRFSSTSSTSPVANTNNGSIVKALNVNNVIVTDIANMLVVKTVLISTLFWFVHSYSKFSGEQIIYQEVINLQSRKLIAFHYNFLSKPLTIMFE